MLWTISANCAIFQQFVLFLAIWVIFQQFELFFSNLGCFSVIFSYFRYLFSNSGNFGYFSVLWTTPGFFNSLCHFQWFWFLFSNFWLLLTIFDYFRLFLAIFSAIFGYFLQVQNQHFWWRRILRLWRSGSLESTCSLFNSRARSGHFSDGHWRFDQ